MSHSDVWLQYEHEYYVYVRFSVSRPIDTYAHNRTAYVYDTDANTNAVVFKTVVSSVKTARYTHSTQIYCKMW